MAAPIRMRIEALITLAQWLSPSFPIRAFSYSHGLAMAVHAGQVRDAATLQDWLAGIITHGAGRTDAILLVTVFRGGDLHTLDSLARALCPSMEQLNETDQQGAAFVRTVKAVWGHDLPDLTPPIAVGAACAREGIPLEEGAHLFLHAFASALVSTATRALPLGQTDGQKR